MKIKDRVRTQSGQLGTVLDTKDIARTGRASVKLDFNGKTLWCLVNTLTPLNQTKGASDGQQENSQKVGWQEKAEA